MNRRAFFGMLAGVLAAARSPALVSRPWLSSANISHPGLSSTNILPVLGPGLRRVDLGRALRIMIHPARPALRWRYRVIGANYIRVDLGETVRGMCDPHDDEDEGGPYIIEDGKVRKPGKPEPDLAEDDNE